MRAWTPREHGLWSWVCVPLAAAVLLEPRAALAAVAVLAGFFLYNALLRRAWGPAGVAGLLGVALASLALPTAPRPLLLLGAFAAGLAALPLGRVPRRAWLEVTGISGLGAFAGLVAIGSGADPSRTSAVMLAIVTWQVLGLWWVRRSLARVLPSRPPWPDGAAVALGFAGLTVAVATWAGNPAAGAVAFLYPLRMVAHRAPAAAADARRVGVAELAWTLAAAALAVAA